MPTPNQQNEEDQLPTDELEFGGDPTKLEAQTEKYAKGYLGSLGSQAEAAQKAVGTAQQGVTAVEEAGKAALAGEREKSGQAFAALQAQGGGGSMAGMREAALKRGVAEGQISGNYTMQQIAAQRLADQAAQEAAKAKGEFYGEAQKLQQTQADRIRKETQEVGSTYDQIIEDFGKAVDRVDWWSDKDAEDFATYIRQTYGSNSNNPNKKVREMADQAAKDIQFKRGQFKE